MAALYRRITNLSNKPPSDVVRIESLRFLCISEVTLGQDFSGRGGGSYLFTSKLSIYVTKNGDLHIFKTSDVDPGPG